MQDINMYGQAHDFSTVGMPGQHGYLPNGLPDPFIQGVGAGVLPPLNADKKQLPVDFEGKFTADKSGATGMISGPLADALRMGYGNVPGGGKPGSATAPQQYAQRAIESMLPRKGLSSQAFAGASGFNPLNPASGGTFYDAGATQQFAPSSESVVSGGAQRARIGCLNRGA